MKAIVKTNNRHKFRLDFKKKMILAILPVLIIILICLGINIYTSSLSTLEERHRSEAHLLANVYAEKVRNLFNVYFEKENTLNTIVSEYNAVDIDIRRDYYVELTKKFLVTNLDITAYWFDFDKDSLDGKDDFYKSTYVYNNKGRANVCWQRSSGKILEEITPDNEATFLEEDYNKLPRKTKSTIITEPYYYSYTETDYDKVLMTSIATPIFNNSNKVIGVTGIDVSLNEIVEFTNSIKPYKESFATLCSSTGRYLAHPNDELLGKNFTDNKYYTSEIQTTLNKYLQKKDEFSLRYTCTNDKQYIIYAIPVLLGKTNSNLWINVHIPYDIIVVGAELLLYKNIFLFGIAILLTTGIILWVSNKLSMPLKKINQELIKLASGDLTIDLSMRKISNNDEIGDIVKSALFVNENVSDLISDTNYLLQEAIKGNFNMRADTTKHPGDYKIILEGSNKIIDILVGVIREIQNLKVELEASEHKYRLITENVKDVVWAIDLATMRYNFVNDSIYETFGYTKSEFLQLYVKDTMTSNTYTNLDGIVDNLLKQYESGAIKEPKHIIELQKIDKWGNLIWVENSFKIIKNDSDIFNQMVCVVRVIEDRKKLEFAIGEKQKELAKANTTKDRFFSIIAHDLKNPISSLFQLSGALIEDLKDNKLADVEDDALILNDTLKQTYELLLNLLEWARSSRGDMVYSPSKNNLQELLQNCADTLKAQAIAKDIDISLVASQNVFVNCDYQMIHTVLRNLLSNAIKFSFSGTKIEVAVADYIDDNSYVVVSVKDAGVGIDEDDMKKLFRIDEKIVSSKGTNNEGGTGLGLILCKEFMDKHNCKIWAESKPGEGTTFLFTLPKLA